MMHINKKLLGIKAHYFLYNAGTAPVVPFVSVYARQLGFSSVIVGLIYTIMPIAGLIIRPTIGALADKFRCQKLIFSIAQIFTAAAFLSIYFVPSLPINNNSDRSMRFSCNDERFVTDACVPSSALTINQKANVQCDLDCPLTFQHWNEMCNSNNVTDICIEHSNALQLKANVDFRKIDASTNCIYFEIEKRFLCSNIKTEIATLCKVINCNASEINAVFRANTIDDEEVLQYYQFWIFVLLMVITAIGQSIIISVGDTICFELLDNKPHKYGQQRAFGALGWGLFSLLAGFMIDTFSKDGERDYLSVFCLGFCMLLVDFIVSSRIRFNQKSSSETIFKDVGKLLLNVRIIIFLGWCVVIGMCTSLIWHFLLWLIEDVATAYDADSKSWISTLQGLVNMVQCLGGELPLFFFSGWIIKKLGHVNTMTLILAAIGLRFVLYSFVVNPWLMLPIEVLNGLTFGLAYATMASHARIISPPGTATTVQGLTGAVFEGIGVSLGSLVGGIIYGKYGGAMTFRIFGIGSFIVCIIHATIQYILQQRNVDKSNTNQSQEQLC